MSEAEQLIKTVDVAHKADTTRTAQENKPLVAQFDDKKTNVMLKVADEGKFPGITVEVVADEDGQIEGDDGKIFIADRNGPLIYGYIVYHKLNIDLILSEMQKADLDEAFRLNACDPKEIEMKV